MTNYRILEKDERYYPQKKFLGLFWYNFHERIISDIYISSIEFVKFEATLEKAKEVIDCDYKQSQKKFIKIHHYNPHP